MRLLSEVKLEGLECAQTCFDRLNLIKGKRLDAMSHGQLRRIKNAFGKRMRLRKFNEVDLVLKKVSHVQKDLRGKWTPNYEGPFVTKKEFLDGTWILINMDGEELPLPVNLDVV